MQSDVGGSLKYIITADIDDFNQGLANASKALDKFADSLNQTASQSGKDLAKGVSSGTEEAQSSISKFVNNSINELKEFGVQAAKVATNLATTFSGMATATFGAWATKGITDTQFLEDTQIQMQALTHSTELGNKAMALATQYFKNNPFNRFDVTDATKQLIQFGATVEEVPALLEKMGNVSLSTGVEINELARIYQQTSSDGKVGLMDIEKLAARGVPIWDAFAKATGKSAAAIREETRKGGVSVEDFKKAFDYLVDEEAMKQNEKTFSRQVDRFKGRLSNMKAALAGYSMDMEKGLQIDDKGLYRSVTNLMKVFSDTMSADIGTKLLNSLTKLASKISPIIDKLAEKIPSLLDKLANGIDFLADHFELLIPILGGALAMFGNLASGIPGLDRVLGPLGNSVKGLGKTFSNLSLPMKILVAILGAGAFKAFKDGSLNDAFKSIAESVGKLAKALAPVVARIAELAANIGSAVLVPTINALAKVLEVLANVISSIPEPVLTGIVTALLGFIALKKTIGPIQQFGSAIGTAFKYFKAGGTISSAIGVFKDIAGIGKKAKDAAKVATGTMDSVSKIGQATQTAGQTMTKGQQFMKTMREGIINLILLAAAIAALAAAMKFAYDTIPNDLGGLVAKLGVMAGVVVAMGAFAFAAGKISDINWKSIALLTALAIPIVAFAGAIWVVDQAVTDDFASIGIKLGILAGVVLAMEGLAGIAGHFAGTEFKGLLIIAGIAGDIAILGLALGVVNQSIPDDFGTFALKLANVGIAVAGMAILAGIVGNFPVQEALGLLIIAGIAGDIALLGLALGVVDREIQSDFGTLIGKLGAMGAAVIEFGVLAGIIGALMATGIGALFLGAGLAGILAITGGMVIVAEALGEIDRVVPTNGERLITKISVMKECLDKMSDAAFGNVLKNFVGMVNIAELAAIAAIYAEIGRILEYMQSLELDEDIIKDRVETIKRCIELVSATDDQSVGGLFKQVIKDFLNLVDVDLARRTLEVYTLIAENLNRIQSIPIDYGTIKDKVNTLKEVVEMVAATDDKSVGQAIAHTCRQFLDTIDTENVGKVINTYKDIAENLNKIQSIEINYDTVKGQVEKIKEVIDLVSYNGDDSLFKMLINGAKQAEDAKAQENCGKILGVYASAVDSLSKIQGFEFDEEGLKSKIVSIRNIVYEAGQVNEIGGIENKEKIVGQTQSIINKFREIADTLNEFKSLPDGIQDTIVNIRNCIYQAGSINEGAGKENQEQIVGRSQSIINKFKEIAETLNNIPGLDSAVEQNIINIRNCVYQAGSINQNAGKENQELVVARTQSIIHKFKEIAEVLNQIPGLDPTTETKITNIRNCIYQAGQINQASANENQELIVARSQSIIHKFKEIAEVLNQIPGLNPAVEANITNIRNCIYMVGQINETPNLEFKEWVVGMSQSILHKFKEFAEVANQLPEFDAGMVQSKIAGIRDTIYQIGTISEIGNIGAIEATAAGAIQVLRNLAEFSQVASTVVNVQQGTFDTISRICQIINESISRLISDINAQLPNFITMGQTMANNLLHGWESVQAPARLKQSVDRIVTELKNQTRTFESIGREYGSSLTRGFNAYDFGAQGRSAGEAVGYGFGNGIASTIWRINSAVGQISAAAVSRLRSLLGIASPSKVFYQLGEYTGLGLAEGLESQIKGVSEAAEEIADAIRSPFEDLNELSVKIANDNESQLQANGGLSKYLTVNQTNNINNGMDYNAMMADLKWELFTA